MGKLVSLSLVACFPFAAETTELKKLKLKQCFLSRYLAWSQSLLFRGTEGQRWFMGVGSLLTRENSLIWIIQIQTLTMKVEIRKAIHFQGFMLLFATIITLGGGEAVKLNVSLDICV